MPFSNKRIHKGADDRQLPFGTCFHILPLIHYDWFVKELKMKKQQVIDPVGLEVKALSKAYRNISRDNIRILHEFCEFDYKRTNRVVCMANQMKNPVSLIEAIIKKPELSEELLGDLERRYEKLYGPELETENGEKKIEETQEEKLVAKLDYNFFEVVPGDCVLRVMEFLDPYSFVTFSRTARLLNVISKSEALAEYYRILCVKLFKASGVVLPADCKFAPIRDYVMQHPNEYGPNTKNAVQNNLRNYVWRMDMGELIVHPQYYKSFGSYEQLFRRCPRLHFNGYYVCREKIVRIGEKSDKYPVTPIHVIYYYRYFRFLPDGTVLYHVRGRRIKTTEVLTFLSGQPVGGEDNPETMVGEYVQHKERVLIKTVRNNTIFSFELEIRCEEGKISNELKVHNYILELVDDHQDIRQVLYLAKPNHEDKVFQYCYNPDIAQENTPLVQATSL